MARRLALALVPLALAAGCQGQLYGSSRDAAGTDAGPRVIVDLDANGRDAGVPPGTDAGPLPPGTDAGPPSPGVDAGPPPPGVDAGPPDPCASVSCMANAHCSSGTCVCDTGFTLSGGACVSLPPGDPAGRTQAEVCMQWNAGHVENASTPWTAGSSMCDAGSMPMAATDDTLRRVNMFRWLAGMPSVSYDGSDAAGMQQCAHMMSVNGMLSHSPPTSWTCYTAGGAAAAGRSNIAWGYSTPGSAIDGYMTDVGTMSLGHRRWILGRRLGRVEIGFSRGGARPGQCLGVFDSSGSSAREWTAYPNQGVAPIDLVTDRFGGTVAWSLQANTFTLPTGTAVSVQRMSDGANLTVTSYLTGGGGPPPSIGFTPSGWTPEAGQTYRVTVTGTSIGTITYDVTLVSC
ncbi:MAG: CAP domain-containing protein [Sandaracinaceae bacterium]